MIRRTIAVLGIAFLASLANAGAAHALGVGVGVTTGPVSTPVPVPGVVASVVGGAEGAVAGTTPVVHGPPADFVGSPDKPDDGVSVASYQAFENLVNDTQDGGGSHMQVITGDAFSGVGVDGGVEGVPSFPATRLLE